MSRSVTWEQIEKMLAAELEKESPSITALKRRAHTLPSIGRIPMFTSKKALCAQIEDLQEHIRRLDRTIGNQKEGQQRVNDAFNNKFMGLETKYHKLSLPPRQTATEISKMLENDVFGPDAMEGRKLNRAKDLGQLRLWARTDGKYHEYPISEITRFEVNEHGIVMEIYGTEEVLDLRTSSTWGFKRA